MCQKESWGAIVATKEAHSTQWDQPPRMHGPGLWRYEQKEQSNLCSDERSELRPPVPGVGEQRSRGRPEQDPGYTSRPWHQYGIRSAAGGAASGVHKACRQIRVHVIKYQNNRPKIDNLRYPM